MSDPDTCVFCETSGCLSGTARHDNGCPFTTGMWPITDEDLRRGAECAACGEPFTEGDLTAQIADPEHHAAQAAGSWFFNTEEEVTFTVCLGCAAMGRSVA